MRKHGPETPPAEETLPTNEPEITPAKPETRPKKTAEETRAVLESEKKPAKPEVRIEKKSGTFSGRSGKKDGEN